MEHTIYLQFDRSGIPFDVYQVRLASENPSNNWGILDMTTNTAIVAWGEVVTSSPTGTYTYTFEVENGHSYFVSWEITANVSETPSYKTDQVGPFYSVNNDNVRAVTDYRGTFVQDTTATLMLKMTNFNGLPAEAEDISVAIYDQGGNSVSLDTTTPILVDTGYYIYDWEIDEDQTPSEYTIIWSYVIDDIAKAEAQYVVVSEDAVDATKTSFYWGRSLEFRLALEHHLASAQSIPIYFEQAKPTRDNKKYRFSFPRWNQSAGVQIYKNQNVVNTGIEVDYFKGTVQFDDTLMDSEVINADYNFKWFTDTELERFLRNGLQSVNGFPPHTRYTFNNLPNRYIPTMLYGAAKDALRHIMFAIQFQEPAQVFGGIENAQKAFQNLQTLKENYEKDWEKLLEQKKYGPYPKTRMIVTPEYTLPGGRSRWFRYLFKGGN